MILVALLVGGAAVSLTSVYLAVRRIRSDITSILRFLRPAKLVVMPDEH